MQTSPQFLNPSMSVYKISRTKLMLRRDDVEVMLCAAPVHATSYLMPVRRYFKEDPRGDGSKAAHKGQGWHKHQI